MQITVKGFGRGDKIPKKFTCDAEDISPEILIDEVPADTKSLALILDDPDAPSGLFTHWIVYNLPPNAKIIPEGAGNKKEINQGINDFGTHGYRGPCPPPGKPHRYYFTLYALNAKISGAIGNRAGINSAIEGKIIGKAEFMGTYGR